MLQASTTHTCSVLLYEVVNVLIRTFLSYSVASQSTPVPVLNSDGNNMCGLVYYSMLKSSYNEIVAFAPAESKAEDETWSLSPERLLSESVGHIGLSVLQTIQRIHHTCNLEGNVDALFCFHTTC